MDKQNLSCIFPIGTTVDEAVRQLIRQTLQVRAPQGDGAAIYPIDEVSTRNFRVALRA